MDDTRTQPVFLRAPDARCVAGQVGGAACPEHEITAQNECHAIVFHS